MRVVSIMGAVGLVVGGALALVLKLVVGARVEAGLGRGDNGSPDRYVDYLVSGSVRPAWLPLLPVLLGTGLVAGLLLGVLVVLARRRRAAGRPGVWPAPGLMVGGALIGLGLAAELHFWGDDRSVGPFGWYAYSPLPSTSEQEGIFYGGGAAPSWWPLLLTGVLTGLAVGLVAVVALTLGARNVASRVAPE